MAIYHFSVQIVKRSAGRSAVTAAAYRAGEKLENERKGVEDDYTKKRDVAYKKIFLPEGASEKFLDRETLWNEVEAAENRKDARLAREINIALPKELTHEQQAQLVENFVVEQFVSRGMIADVCLHRPKPRKKNDHDHEMLQEEEEPKQQENDHAHVMLTTREVSGGKFLGKNRDWNKKELIEEWRVEWERAANRALEKAGREERIDHRSLKAQGVDREAQIHEGFAAREIEHRAPGTSERVRMNREIKERNERRKQNARFNSSKSQLRDTNRELRRPSERSRAKNPVRFRTQPGLGSVGRGKGSNFETFGRKHFLPDVPLFGVGAKTGRASVLLPGAERGGLEVDRAEGVRDLRLQRETAASPNLKVGTKAKAPSPAKAATGAAAGIKKALDFGAEKILGVGNAAGGKPAPEDNTPFSMLTKTAQKEKQADHRFDENWDADEGQSLKTNVSYIAPEEKKPEKKEEKKEEQQQKRKEETEKRENPTQKEPKKVEIEKPQEVKWAEESVKRIEAEEKAVFDKIMTAKKAGKIDIKTVKEYKEFNSESRSELRRREDGLEKKFESTLEAREKHIKSMEAKAEADYMEKSPLKPELDRLKAAEGAAWEKYSGAKDATLAATKRLDGLLKAEPSKGIFGGTFGKSKEYLAWEKDVAGAKKALDGAKKAESGARGTWDKANSAANGVRVKMQAGAKEASSGIRARECGPKATNPASIAFNAAIQVLEITLTLIQTCMKVMDAHNQVMREIVSTQQQTQERVMVRSLY